MLLARGNPARFQDTSGGSNLDFSDPSLNHNDSVKKRNASPFHVIFSLTIITLFQMHPKQLFSLDCNDPCYYFFRSEPPDMIISSESDRQNSRTFGGGS